MHTPRRASPSFSPDRRARECRTLGRARSAILGYYVKAITWGPQILRWDRSMDGQFFVGTADVLTVFVALFGVALLMLALIPVMLVLLARSAWRRVRRDPRWMRTTMLVQEKTSAPGPRRSLFQLRLRLADAIASAKQSVAVLEVHGGVR